MQRADKQTNTKEGGEIFEFAILNNLKCDKQQVGKLNKCVHYVFLHILKLGLILFQYVLPAYFFLPSMISSLCWAPICDQLPYRIKFLVFQYHGPLKYTFKKIFNRPKLTKLFLPIILIVFARIKNETCSRASQRLC